MSDYDSYISSIQRYKRISKEREKELSTIINENENENKVDSAKQELVEANLFLVVSRALKIYRQFKYHSLMDLIAEGNIALIKAADRYNAFREEGASSFGTFATNSIDQSIYRFTKLDRLIHVPESHFRLMSKIRELEEEYKDDLTDEIILKELDISEKFLKLLRYDTSKRTISLEEVNIKDSDGESSWEDTIVDTSCPSPIKKSHLDSLGEHLKIYIDTLTPKEQKAIKVMFDSNNVTLKEASVIMGVSSERIRQLLAKGLYKLRKRVGASSLYGEDNKPTRTTTRARTTRDIDESNEPINEPNELINEPIKLIINRVNDRYDDYRKKRLTYNEIFKLESVYGENMFMDFAVVNTIDNQIMFESEKKQR